MQESSSLGENGYTKDFQIFAVYHAFPNKNNGLWRELIRNQLLSVKRSGFFNILDKFYVTLTTGLIPSNESNSSAIHLLNQAIDIIHNIHPSTIISIHVNDTFWEYPGIYKIWNTTQLCIETSKCLLVYFHAKSIYRNIPGIYIRTHANIVLTKTVIEDWQYIINQFHINKNLSTVGLVSGCESPFQFYNFWWSRGDYLSSVNQPLKDYDRNYYEWKFLGQSSIRREADILCLCSDKYNIISPPNYPFCTDGDYANYGEKCLNNLLINETYGGEAYFSIIKYVQSSPYCFAVIFSAFLTILFVFLITILVYFLIKLFRCC